jgi:hypothetical protein
MVAMGGGGVLVLDAAVGSASYKGERTRSSKAIDGGAELEAVVASDASPLIVAQNWKQSCSLSWCRPLNRRDEGDEEATIDDTRPWVEG